MVISSSQELEARFAHLIQPIRDLTRNWNVDIASQLEDYLEEIGAIAISFDGGQTTLNFAEAALLIQGSVCVYSRKVEYLHALVYQVLDLIASKKKLQQVASVDADGNDKDTTTLNRRRQDDDEFLSLDDVKDHKNIDIKLDADQPEKGAHGLPRVTLSLIPLEEGEKRDSRLLSHKGEVLGSRKDFNMNTSNIFSRGTLLLDLTHLDLLELSFRNIPTSTPFVPRTGAAPTQTEQPPSDQTGLPVDEGLPLDVSMEAEDNLSFNPGHECDVSELPAAVITEKRDCLRTRQERNKNIINKVRVHPDEDPWTHLEPHQKLSADKLLKKKKTYKLLMAMDSDDGRKRKRNKKVTTVPQEPLLPISDFCTKAFYSRAAQFPKNPLKVPTFPEFENLYWREFKLRQARLKQERRKLVEQGPALMFDAEDNDHENSAEGFEVVAGDDAADDLDADNVARRVDFQIPEVTDLGPLAPIPDPLEEFEGGDIAGGGPWGGQDDDGDPPIISSYEQLVRQHVEGYMASAQQYAQITELSRRVSEWEEKILPKLQEEDEHRPFDIHEYGTNVLDSVSKQSQDARSFTESIPFRRVCSGRPSYEVCRLFLATLQLANNYNVEISSKGTLANAIDTMSLKVLSTKQHFEELEEYRAPSVDT